MSIDPFVPATLHASSEPSSEDPRRVLAFCIWPGRETSHAPMPILPLFYEAENG